MNTNRRWISGMAALVLLMAGCSPSTVHLGNRELDQGNYKLALDHFNQAVEEDWDNFAAWSGLGRAYYYLKNYDQAIEHLERARRARPDDGQTILYLGLAKEGKNDFVGAERAYRDYLNAYPKAKISRRIKGRLLFVRNEKARQQVRQALQFDAPLIGDTTAMTVGVLPFLPAGESLDSLRPLAAGLTALVSSDLFKIENIKLVERTQIKYLLDELALVEEGFTVEGSSPRVGLLLGANHLVRGDLAFSEANRVAVQSGVVNTSDSIYNVALESEEEFARIWSLQKKITLAIVENMGIKLTAAERRALEKIPTSNFEAFWAYCKGIEQLDQGNYGLAHDYFGQAAELDPNFEQAISFQEQTDLLMEGGGTTEEFESSVTADVPTEPEVPMASAPEEDIFEITEPSTDARTDDEPAVGTGTATVSGTIR